jgi:hypothetical protein
MDSRLEHSISLTSPTLARNQLHLMVTQPEPSVSSNGVQVGLEGEEIREVASQLGLIRKRPDAA